MWCHLKQFLRLLGHMATVAAATSLGLLHMRSLQHWLHSWVPRWAWCRGTLRVNITLQCRRFLSPWTDLVFLRAVELLELLFYFSTVVTTDTSKHGLGRYMQRAGSLGALDGAPTALAHQLPRAVHLASRQFRPLLLGKHVLARTDNTAACLVHQLVGRYTITPHVIAHPPSHPLESHAVQVTARCSHPGEAQSCGRCVLTTVHIPPRVVTPSETIRLIWSWFGEAQVDLFASHESTHCQLYFSLTEGPLGTDALAHSWPRKLTQVCVSPSEPIHTDHCASSGRTHWPTRTWFPELISLVTAPPWRIPLRKGPPLLGARHHMAPASRSMGPPCVVPGRDAADSSGLPPAVVKTITQARAPSTRQTYALKWSLFTSWCSSCREDPPEDARLE